MNAIAQAFLDKEDDLREKGIFIKEEAKKNLADQDAAKKRYEKNRYRLSQGGRPDLPPLPTSQQKIVTMLANEIMGPVRAGNLRVGEALTILESMSEGNLGREKRIAVSSLFLNLTDLLEARVDDMEDEQRLRVLGEHKFPFFHRVFGHIL